jgi:hypothetical protein
MRVALHMEQSALDIKATAKAVGEQIDRALLAGAEYPVIDGGPRRPPADIHAPADQHRGLLRSLADAALYLVCGRRIGDTFADRQRD